MTATAILGSTLPRLYTEPLPGRRTGAGCVEGCSCGLTPETSDGFEVIEWSSDVLGIELNPWQRWLLVHALELDEACELYRFRIILVMVARQNGKTLVKAVLTLWRMYVRKVRYLVGTAQDLSQAREVMNEVLVPMILECPRHEDAKEESCRRCGLRDRFDPDAEDLDRRRGIWHKTLNDEYFRLDSRWRGGRAVGPYGPRYLIKALNRKAGRGLSDVGEVNIDELREQTDHKGWAAISKVVMANQSGPQIWCMSNAGDSTSVVLNQLRAVGLAGTDPFVFHAEWSASEGCELSDESEWPKANPSLGYTLPIDAIRSSLADPPNVFRTEVLCQNVDILATAVDSGAWKDCRDAAGAMAGGRVSGLCFEVASEGDQVVAVSATLLDDSRVRLNVVGVWASTTEAKADLRALKRSLRPRAIGWFPKGPGSVLGAAMRSVDGKPMKGEAAIEACMTFVDYVDERRILHPGDPLLDAHASHTGTAGSAQAWTFDRDGETHALWAAAGALHLALTGPSPRSGRRDIILPDG